MPLPPILMRPAFRSGEATPWGGTRLRELFNKDTPDARTGESLEVSTVANLNSLDSEGTPLSRLVERHGKALVGTDVKGDFPLLLKLLDAREDLSVQVHPDDAYAQANERKLGKSEAWIILSAVPDAHIVCGFREDVTMHELRQVNFEGPAVESLLRRVPVAAGDVIYLAPGTVHAIGAGIVLYEIQQSSDLTYRFYDWDRRDQHGNKRKLHLEKAMAVVDPTLRPDKSVPKKLSLPGGRGNAVLLVDAPHFITVKYTHCNHAVIPADRRRFAMLTALEPGVLHYLDRQLELAAGSTALLPANGEELLFTGNSALLSAPNMAD
jgi:mannose-6-phosphate isomerase